MREKQHYLALDLEYNCDGKNPTEDIIQVGFAIGSPDKGVFLQESYLVQPKNKNVTLHSFITELTGITQENYDKNSVSWSVVVDRIRELHEYYKPFVNPVTWGLGDAADLIETVKNEELDFPFFGRRIIDVKHFFLFIEAAKGRAMSGGLRSAMNKHRLKFNGEPHRADDDAKNTLRFFFYLLKRQALLEETVDTLKTLS
jgi:inhibitor of KinA sporulation pathway (predicted exonuclease)